MFEELLKLKSDQYEITLSIDASELNLYIWDDWTSEGGTARLTVDDARQLGEALLKWSEARGQA